MFLKKGYVLGNRYEIIDKIGAGGMSIVYKAHCMHLQRTVAIKVLREEFLEDNEFVNKFSKEAQAVASLSHPNIVNVYDVGKDGDVYYIVMEYLEGKDLSEIIEKVGKIDENSALTILYNIAEALNYAHKNNIVHRDLKSKNIIINDDGIVKVADFGIATATTSSTISVATNAIGSVHYFSPEQAKGEKVDARSDIYSLGIIAYELFTGKLPFDGETPVAVALKHVSEKMPKPSLLEDVSENIDYLVLKATSKKPEERYQNANDIMRDIDSILEGKDITQKVNKNKDVVSNFSKILNDYNEAKSAEEKALKAEEKSENMSKNLDKFNAINEKIDEELKENDEKNNKRKGTINKILNNLGIYTYFNEDEDEKSNDHFNDSNYEELKDEEENYLMNSENYKEEIETKEEDIDDLKILEVENASSSLDDKKKRPGYISLDVKIKEDEEFENEVNVRTENASSKAALAAAKFFDEIEKDDKDSRKNKTNKPKVKKKKFNILDFITLEFEEDEEEQESNGYYDNYEDEDINNITEENSDENDEIKFGVDVKEDENDTNDFEGGNLMAKRNSNDEYISKEEDKKLVNAAVITSLVIIAFILIGMIKYMIYLNDNKLIKVPDFTGLIYEDIKDEWQEKGIKIEVVGEEVNLRIGAGGIISQNVEEDSMINKNSVVEVILSKGKNASIMPDLQARSVEEAKAALEKYSVQITTVEIENEDIQKGYIVKTNPEYGAGIEEGMAVVLYLSLGKEEEEVKEYIVPSLLGMSEDEAKKALEKIGLELGSIKRQSGATKTNSKVIAQSENAGNEVEKGTKINITVAKDANSKEDDESITTGTNKNEDKTSKDESNDNDDKQNDQDEKEDSTQKVEQNNTQSDNQNAGTITTVAIVKIQPKFEINAEEIYLVQVVVESPSGETKMKYSQKHNGNELPLSKSFNVEVGSTVSVYIDNELQSENYID